MRKCPLDSAEVWWCPAFCLMGISRDFVPEWLLTYQMWKANGPLDLDMYNFLFPSSHRRLHGNFHYRERPKYPAIMPWNAMASSTSSVSCSLHSSKFHINFQISAKGMWALHLGISSMNLCEQETHIGWIIHCSWIHNYLYHQNQSIKSLFKIILEPDLINTFLNYISTYSTFCHHLSHHLCLGHHHLWPW